MSVATTVDRSAIEAWLAHYGLGPLRELTPTGNPAVPYLLTTTDGHYRMVLPTQAEPAAFCLALTTLLADAGLPCARPLMTRGGQSVQPLAGRAAALLPDCASLDDTRPTITQCAALGEMLARLHLAARDFRLRRDNPQGLPRWRALAAALGPQLGGEADALLTGELRYQALYRFADLPRGTIHGRPLPRQMGFSDAGVADLGDLTHACTDSLLVDLALAVAGCARVDDGALDPGRVHALLDAYHARRPLTPIERGAWPTLLRAAALQLWLAALAGAATSTQAAPFAQLLYWLTTHEKDVRALWPHAATGSAKK